MWNVVTPYWSVTSPATCGLARTFAGQGYSMQTSALDASLDVMEVERFDAHLQRLLNAHEVPRRYIEAPFPGPIPIRARLVWEVDGEEWADGRAMAWTSRLVLVELQMEQRLQVHGAWLEASDVARLT